MDSERRQQRRFRIAGTATVKMADGSPHIFAPLVDMSASGCYIETLYPLSVGTEVELTIVLKGLEGPISVKATVRTADQGVGMGIKFREECTPRVQEFLEKLEKDSSA